VCSPAAASFGSGAVSAIGGAMQASQANKAAKRDYEYKLKVRENRWMRERTTYATKKVQYQRNLSEANMAAQRAYSQSQSNLNRIRQQAMLDHSEDFKEMLKAEGMIEAQAAERGVRGASVQRAITANLGKMGLANAARARALTQTLYRFNEHNEGVARQARSKQNQLFGKVAISPVQDIPPPPPVMQNVGATLFLGLASAGFDAAGTYYSNKAPTIQKPGGY
tara:strand:+ start:28 stop:696 length:669 start_codon:yes stop_codon:yes gene_type:complete